MKEKGSYPKPKGESALVLTASSVRTLLTGTFLILSSLSLHFPSASFLPNDLGFTDTYSQKAFCGIYSKDGQIFMSACQGTTPWSHEVPRNKEHTP